MKELGEKIKEKDRVFLSSQMGELRIEVIKKVCYNLRKTYNQIENQLKN